MNTTQEPIKPLKTWSHLSARRKKPSEYEIVSVNLHTTQREGQPPFELDPNLPLALWYTHKRDQSPLRHPDWNAFRDPSELTYRVYNIVQDGQESFVTGLLNQMSDREHDRLLEPTWAGSLARLYAPLRYVHHGLQMMSAYLTMMAPASTISNCASYQTGDHFRWVSHTAYRTAELGKTFPSIGLGQDERRYWEDDPAWQGLRKLLELALVTWDWAEAFVVLNLVVKPCLEEGFMQPLADAARDNGDTLLPLLVDSQLADARRHRRWAAALTEMALSQDGNRALLQSWLDKWMPLADAAIQAYALALHDDERAARARKSIADFHRSIGL